MWRTERSALCRCGATVKPSRLLGTQPHRWHKAVYQRHRAVYQRGCSTAVWHWHAHCSFESIRISSGATGSWSSDYSGYGPSSSCFRRSFSTRFCIFFLHNCTRVNFACLVGSHKKPSVSRKGTCFSLLFVHAKNAMVSARSKWFEYIPRPVDCVAADHGDRIAVMDGMTGTVTQRPGPKCPAWNG